ncbi:MAG: ABC transporter permease [Spirochaetales bacterium]
MTFKHLFNKNFGKYLLGRIGQTIMVIIIGITITFIIPRLAPTNPVELKIQQMMVSGANIHPEAIRQFREAMNDIYGLKGTLLEQYVNFWGRLARGDLGPSIFSFPYPATDIIMKSMPWTIGLLLSTSVISWIFGNLLGGLAGYYSNRRWTRWAELLANSIRPIPYYIFAFILLIVFCFVFPLFPTLGAYDRGMDENWMNPAFLLSVLHHTFLPALSLVLTGLGGWLLGMRALVSNIISEDYVQYAEVAGVKKKTILYQYVMRNAMLPQITGLGMSLGGIFSGALITEYVFGIPGMGQLAYRAIVGFDYSLIMGVSIFSIVGVSVAVLIVDLLYPIFDPRVRLN